MDVRVAEKKAKFRHKNSKGTVRDVRVTKLPYGVVASMRGVIFGSVNDLNRKKGRNFVIKV